MGSNGAVGTAGLSGTLFILHLPLLVHGQILLVLCKGHVLLCLLQCSIQGMSLKCQA